MNRKRLEIRLQSLEESRDTLLEAVDLTAKKCNLSKKDVFELKNYVMKAYNKQKKEIIFDEKLSYLWEPIQQRFKNMMDNALNPNSKPKNWYDKNYLKKY